MSLTNIGKSQLEKGVENPIGKVEEVEISPEDFKIEEEKTVKDIETIPESGISDPASKEEVVKEKKGAIEKVRNLYKSAVDRLTKKKSVENISPEVGVDSPTEELGINLDILKKEIESVDESKLTPEQKSTFLKIKEKIFNITKKFIRTAEWVTLVTGVLGVANYERTHSNLVEKNNEKNEVTYSHKDQRTTHLLNILARKEKFNESDLMSDIRPLIDKACEEGKVSLPKSVDEMSLDDIDKFLVENQKALLPNDSKEKLMLLGDFKKEFIDELVLMNKKDDTIKNIPNKDLYNLVWQLEEECGNPEIRFNEEKIGFTPFKEFQGKSHYDPINNVIYIDRYDLTYNNFSSFFPEMSHANQFNKNQIGSYLNVCTDFLSIFKKAGFDSYKIGREYNNRYYQPGSVEHEAHQVIEPYLKNKYKLFTQRTTHK